MMDQAEMVRDAGLIGGGPFGSGRQSWVAIHIEMILKALTFDEVPLSREKVYRDNSRDLRTDPTLTAQVIPVCESWLLSGTRVFHCQRRCSWPSVRTQQWNSNCYSNAGDTPSSQDVGDSTELAHGNGSLKTDTTLYGTVKLNGSGKYYTETLLGGTQVPHRGDNKSHEVPLSMEKVYIENSGD